MGFRISYTHAIGPTKLRLRPVIKASFLIKKKTHDGLYATCMHLYILRFKRYEYS